MASLVRRASSSGDLVVAAGLILDLPLRKPDQHPSSLSMGCAIIGREIIVLWRTLFRSANQDGPPMRQGPLTVLISEPQLKEMGVPFLPTMWGILKSYWEKCAGDPRPVNWLRVACAFLPVR